MVTTSKYEFKHEEWRNNAAFWILGFINNISYVIMIAGAEEIVQGGVGLVYVCDVLPSLLIKSSAPYWFHLISYESRVWIMILFMFTSFQLLAFGNHSLILQLMGVLCTGVQSGLGEASFLALTSYYKSDISLTFWCSGTGFSGIGGYLWILFFHQFLNFSFSYIYFLASSLSFFFGITFFYLLRKPWKEYPNTSLSKEIMYSIIDENKYSNHESLPMIKMNNDKNMNNLETIPFLMPDWKQRFSFVLSLWPYMIPLSVVYFAEYTLQSGVWTVIGFPVTSSNARKRFYFYAGTAYQFGVFFARSCGTFFHLNQYQLFIFPCIQIVLLFIFCIIAIYHFFYGWYLLLLCFLVGFIGGTVYVHAFILISKDISYPFCELALGAASVADTFGILMADICSLFLQGCLYSINGLSGANFATTC